MYNLMNKVIRSVYTLIIVSIVTISFRFIPAINIVIFVELSLVSMPLFFMISWSHVFFNIFCSFVEMSNQNKILIVGFSSMVIVTKLSGYPREDVKKG